MFITEVFFRFKHKTQKPIKPKINQIQVINQVIDEWRYNGQILGREIPVYLAKQENYWGYGVKVICPEEFSLMPECNNIMVERAISEIENQQLIFDSFNIVAQDLNSEQVYKGVKPNWQILYTTYLHSCSPLWSGNDFLPIPLYKFLQKVPHLTKDAIKWQENWQDCDELQMNGSILENQALFEISNTSSNLFKHGYSLAKEITYATTIPTYYYLYCAAGKNKTEAKNRLCPICQQQWALNEPLFDIFHFKCDRCRLVSNLAWQWQ